MESLTALRSAVDVSEWRRLATGLVLRSLLSVVGFGLGGLLLFGFVALLTELALVDGGWIRALYLPYVLLGALVGANLGLGAALRRESRAMTERTGGLLAPLVDRAVDELGVPEQGMEVERLRALAGLEGVAPEFDNRLTRWFAGFAVRRALEQAGFRAVREQMVRAADEAEARGETVVSQASVREAARHGLGVAFAEQLDVGWRANRGASRLFAGALLLSLPMLAVLFG